MKPTQKNLAEHIGMSTVGLSKLKKRNPEMFALLWDGWVKKCEEEKEKVFNNRS